MDREGDLTKKPTSSPSVEDRFVLENSGHRVSFFFNGSLSVLFLFFSFLLFSKVRFRSRDGRQFVYFLIRFF